MLPFGGDKTRMEEKSRAASMGPVGLHLHILHFIFCTLLHAHSSILSPAAPGQHKTKWPNFFANFCEVLFDVEFQKSNMLYVGIS